MSSNEIHSRKSRYTEKYEENSSLCNRSMKSNVLSVDLPQNRKKYSKIEHELLSRYNAKGAIIINLASNKDNTKIQNIQFYNKFVEVRVSIGRYKILGRLRIGK